MFLGLRLPSKTILLILAILLGGCLTARLPKVEIRRDTEAKTWRWDALVKEALQSNPDLKNARRQVVSGARSRDIAFGDYLPSVTGGLQKSASRTTATGPTKDQLALNVVGTQSIFDGFGTTGEWLRARKNLDALRLSYLETSAEVRLRLRRAYVELMQLERLLDVAKRIAERREENAELVMLRYEGGRENLGSALRAEAISKQAAYEVDVVLRRMDSQTLRLARESGADFVLPVQIDDDLEDLLHGIELPAQNYTELANEAPRVLKQIKTAEAYKAAVVTAQSTIWPQIDGKLDYGYSGGKASDLRDRNFLGLTVSVPFFNGGKNVEGVLKAKADYEAAWEAAVSFRNETLAQLAEAWAKFADAADFVEVRRRFLVASRKRAEIIRSEYANGLVGFQEFDIAEQENANAELAYVESMANVFLRQAEWDQIRGATLEDVLYAK
jgi:outer membrane protein TolC